MKLLTLATVVAGVTIAGCGGAAAMPPSVKVNRAALERNDPTWQHAWFEVAHIPLTSTTALPLLKRGNTGERVIALTFDDGPHGPNTLRLLKILKQENQQATFFLVGKMAKKHPELVQAIAKAGHEIGNHTFSHATLTHLTEEEARADYEACNDVITGLTGKRPVLCRPPGGDSDPAVVRAGSSLGMTTVLWTTDPGDYDLPGSDAILERTLRQAKPGGIILLHDGITQMLDVLPEIIESLRSEGYRLVTAGELAAMTEEAMERDPSPKSRQDTKAAWRNISR